MSNKPISNFGLAPIKMEGGISDPDEWRFECPCGECQKLRQRWKVEYDAQQKLLRGEA